MKLIYLTFPQFGVFCAAVAWVSGWLNQFYPLWIACAFTIGALFMFNGLGAALEILFRTPIEVEAEDE